MRRLHNCCEHRPDRLRRDTRASPLFAAAAAGHPEVPLLFLNAFR